MTDVEVLERVAAWLTKTYKRGQRLSGIVYTHPITSTRMTGSAARGLDVFSGLVGPKSFHSIILVTTMWDLLPNASVGEKREEELQNQFWRALIDGGSLTARSFGDRSSALAIVRSMASSQLPGASLAIQRK